MIAPLHGGRSAAEILAKLGGVKWWRGHPLVRATMRKVLAQGDFEASWKSALQSGIVRDGDAVNATLNAAGVAIAAGAIGAADGGSPAAVEVDFSPDPALGDGRSGNNPWMLELPHPLSCISWDNAAYFSAKTASELGVKNEDLVLIKDGQGNPAEVVAWVLPGQADGSVSVHLGWGRPAAGQYGAGVGFDLYPLRTTGTMGFSSGCSVELVGRKHDVVQTQETHSMEGRPVAVDATLEEYRKNPDFAEDASPTFSAMPLWKEVDYSKGHKWGMTIDLSTCSGCNACLVACQSENNVATVGKEQVGRGRDMYWQRLDRYFVGADEANPGVAFQPVACVQCEEAPCENVCPVAATAHSPEGLNDMAYNRCIGTRYCMNNCPYKVRRFNFLDYTGKVPEVRRMQYNPNVTVRMRGTMEKCSYCVQRIQEARISARRDERPLKGESVVMACQQACSSGAIVFGDLNDKDSEVYKLSKLDRSYKLLAGVGTQPRTTYLGKIRNPNPEMQA